MTHVLVPIDDQVWRAVYEAQPLRSYATEHIASGKLSSRKGEGQGE